MNQTVDLAVVDPRLRGVRRPADTGPSSGLCRALAQRFGIDPLVLRIAAIALTFAAGLGLVLYAWGTLLTPRVGGVAPIQNILPAFARWTRTTQLLVVGISTLAIVTLSASTTGLPIGPAVVLLVVFLIVRRRREAAPTQWGPWSPGAQPGALSAPGPSASAADGTAERAEPETVEAWRAHIGAYAARPPAAGDPLPIVDLYGSVAGTTATLAPVPRPPVTWAGGAVVILLGLAGAAAPLLLGLQPVVAWSLAGATLALGVSFLLWALLVRSRRLPAAILIAALVTGAGAAGISLQHAGPMSNAGAAADTVLTSGQSVTYPFMAANDGLVDLRDTPLDVVAEVRIDATASNVRVLLPGAPLAVQTQENLSRIEYQPIPGGQSTPKASSITLVINANLSNVTLEYPQ